MDARCQPHVGHSDTPQGSTSTPPLSMHGRDATTTLCMRLSALHHFIGAHYRQMLVGLVYPKEKPTTTRICWTAGDRRRRSYRSSSWNCMALLMRMRFANAIS